MLSHCPQCQQVVYPKLQDVIMLAEYIFCPHCQCVARQQEGRWIATGVAPPFPADPSPPLELNIEDRGTIHGRPFRVVNHTFYALQSPDGSAIGHEHEWAIILDNHRVAYIVVEQPLYN